MPEDYDLEDLMERLEEQIAAGEDIEKLLEEAAAHGVTVQVGDQSGEVEMDPMEIKITPEEMAAFDTYKLKASEMMRLRLAELKIEDLASSQAITAAIAQLTNQAQFASEFDATPNYKKALADAFLGSWEDNVKDATKAGLMAMGLPDVATPVFDFISVIQQEEARALAAASEKSVKDFLNKALTGVVKNMSKTIKELGKDSAITKACVGAAHEAAMGYWLDDQESGSKNRDGRLVEFCDQLQDALSQAMKIGTMDISARHAEALKGLITGITAVGYLDFGLVYHNTEVSESDDGRIQFNLTSQEPTFANGNTPSLRGTPDDKRFGNAINDYLRQFGGSINDLDIEKRVHYELRLASKGFFSDFRGYVMDGEASWTTGQASGVHLNPRDLLNYFKGDIPRVFFDYANGSFQTTAKYLDADRVTA
jgi:hypothetical protein